MDKAELPAGFAFALARNPDAMKKFANLSESEKSEIMQRVHQVSSKREMQALVASLTVSG